MGNECLSKTDTVKISNQLKKRPFSLPFDTVICKGDPISLPVSGRGYHYRWTDGSLLPSKIVEGESILEFEAFDRCYVYDYNIIARVRDCVCELFIPKAFTPNNDAHNQQFSMSSICDFTEFEIHIYNRWGEQVYASKKVNFSWDGTNGESECPIDLYHYKITYSYALRGELMRAGKVGEVYLLR
jgi:gliding motility-associated-like protein